MSNRTLPAFPEGEPSRGASSSSESPRLPDVPGYRVLEWVAEGGMGMIYAAVAEDHGRRVAIKLVRPELVSMGSAERILREVHALAAISHPAIVGYIDHGTTDEGRPFLVTEWLEGMDLEQRLRAGPLPEEEVVALAVRLAEGLAAAHECGVVHRDIKPANVFLVGGRARDARVLDFGIARFTAPSWTLTSPGKIIGTPAYMAPEQARGGPDVGPRADLFSLGCVLYECLAGHPPFAGDNAMAVLAKVLLEHPTPVAQLVPGVPRLLDALVMELLSKDASRRPVGAREVSRRARALSSNDEAAPVPVALTENERTFCCVLLIRGKVDTGGAPLRLARLAEEHLGRYLTLVDGTRLIHMEKMGVASDLVYNAVRCAIAVERIAPRLAIAVASGLAEGSGRTMVGRALDRGARLLARTPAGRIRIDDDTARLLEARYELELERDEDGVLVARDSSDGLAPRAAARSAPPMFGRHRELALLRAALDECVEERRAAALAVIGEAGVGKSRLFLEMLEGLGSEVTVLHGRAESMRTQAPLSVVSRLVREAAGLVEGESPSARRERLRARLGRHLQGAEQERALTFLGELVSAFSDRAPPELAYARERSAVMRERIAEAWRAWLSAEGRGGPLVVVLEDVHWADEASVELVLDTVTELADLPLLVLLNARPEVDARFPRVAASEGIERHELATLSRRAADMLVRRWLGDETSTREVERIVDCGGGNALFLEELVRAVEGGDHSVPPGSVLAMMQTRQASLSSLQRKVLRATSVFGRAAALEGVGRLLGDEVDDAGLRSVVDELVRTRWLVPSGQRGGRGETVGFRHDLVRDAVYATLTHDDRRLGHRLAANWLEEVGELDAVVLAEHRRRGGDPEAATQWFARAADTAYERHQLDAVLQVVERGLEGAPRGDARGRLLLRRAEVEAVAGRHREAARLARDAVENLSPYSPRWYRAAGEAALSSARAGETREVGHIVEALNKIDPTAGGSAGDLIGLVRAALPLVAEGESASAWCLADTAVRVAERMAKTDPEALGPMHSAAAVRALVSGALDVSYREVSLAAAAFERVGNGRAALEHSASSGFLLLELGGLERAEPGLRNVIERSEPLGLEHLCAVTRHNLGRRVGEANRVEEGLRLERLAFEGFERHGNHRMRGLTSCHIAWLLATSGRADEAWAHVAEVVEPLRPHRASHAIALATRAQVLLRLGREQDALRDARRAHEELGKLGRLQEGESFIRVTWCDALHAAGDPEGAKEVARSALRNLRERAERIVHEGLRASFVTQVYENARIEELAARWGVEDRAL